MGNGYKQTSKKKNLSNLKAYGEIEGRCPLGQYQSNIEERENAKVNNFR